MSASALEVLRRQLREKFPQACGVDALLRSEVCAPFGEVGNAGGTGLALADFPPGVLAELVPGGAGSGLGLVLAALLGDPEEVCPHPEVGLVDGADGFDPASFSGRACGRLLWVRCRSAVEMLKATEWLVRDGNLPLVLMDAAGLGRRDLAALPTTAWWRLRQSVERAGCRLVVLAAGPVVPSAGLRVVVDAGLDLGDFDRRRGDLVQRLRVLPESLRQVR